MNVAFSMLLFCLVMIGCCEAFDGAVNLAGSAVQIRVHDAFYPHPHMRDLKAIAKRGKILVLTLVVSAGLVVLVSTAIVRGGKDKKSADDTKIISPAELRARVIAAATAGQRALARGREQALVAAFSTYAGACGVGWEGEAPEHSLSVTCSIGRDSVTVTMSSDSSAVEVRAICGNMGASATANAEDDSIRSSVFRSHALEGEANV